MHLKRSQFSLNPLWPHYAAWTAILVALVAGILRFTVLDPVDPLHCGSLMSRGVWLDRHHRNWQPEGCMLHHYTPKDASLCLSSRHVVFIGDSIARNLFFRLAHVIDPTLPNSPPDDEHKHTDHKLHSQSAVQLSFYWDPFLNTSRTHNFISPTDGSSEGYSMRRPVLLVLGSGLWYLRYSGSSGGLFAWEANIEAILGTINRAPPPADEIVILPVEEVVPSKLSHERAISMRSSDIEAMNADLLHRINPPRADWVHLFADSPQSMPVSLPLAFNSMLDDSQTEDGLHFSDAVVSAQANVLLNFRCNDVLPKKFPLDKTCCRRYPWPSALHFLILVATILWGPAVWFLSRQDRGIVKPLIKDQLPAIVFSAAIALIYLADRTGLWLKEQKQFSPWTFTLLASICLSVGLATVKRADKDLGFLNRDQTDEWKGWMQIAILLYHYMGASNVSGIYNSVRVLVAAYLFMTGYGHTTFYIRKADFKFLRVAHVMVRLNLFTVLLAYTMNTDYLSYYFTPLVSMWYLITYGTMAVGSRFNDRSLFLVAKIFMSAGITTWFMSEPWLLEAVFHFLSRFCGIHWSAREWAFRVNLDLWIVYFGMLTALVVIKIREHRLTDHPRWTMAIKLFTGASGIVVFWFIAFELLQDNKFAYNAWHPFISFLPIAAFIVLRNANVILRSASSKAFAFVGTCSLEMFIIQYHFWLAGDTKGILLVLPGTRWRPMNFVITTVMFIYVSHQVSQATGEITMWICGGKQEHSLPAPPTTCSSSSHHRVESEYVPEAVTLMSSDLHIRKDNDLPPEPDTPIRPMRRWVDRLAEGAAQQGRTQGWHRYSEWNPGVGTKLATGVALMWVVNILWKYP